MLLKLTDLFLPILLNTITALSLNRLFCLDITFWLYREICGSRVVILSEWTLLWPSWVSMLTVCQQWDKTTLSIFFFSLLQSTLQRDNVVWRYVKSLSIIQFVCSLIFMSTSERCRQIRCVCLNVRLRILLCDKVPN